MGKLIHKTRNYDDLWYTMDGDLCAYDYKQADGHVLYMSNTLSSVPTIIITSLWGS